MRTWIAALGMIGCLLAGAPRPAEGWCKYAEPHLSCVNLKYTAPEGWEMSNWTQVLTSAQPPPLRGAQALTMPGGKNFLAVLPINDMVVGLQNTLNQAAHTFCYMPVMYHATVAAQLAANSRTYRELAACREAPTPVLPSDVEKQTGYVYGSFKRLSDIKGRPKRFRNRVPALNRFSTGANGRYFGNMSACAILNPCQGSEAVYLGFQNMQTLLNLNYVPGFESSVRLALRLRSYAYSLAAQARPSEWRGDDTAWVWWLPRADPLVAGDLGSSNWVQLVTRNTPPTGSTYLKGSLPGGFGTSLIRTRTWSIDLGQQNVAWALVRDANFPAPSLGMSDAPEVSLWGGRLVLPFRSSVRRLPERLRRGYSPTQLTFRPADQRAWLTTVWKQPLSVAWFVDNIKAVGQVLGKVLLNNQGAIASMDLYNGLDSLALRLSLPPGTYRLSPRVAAVAGVDTITTSDGDTLALIFSALTNATGFQDYITLEHRMGADVMLTGRRAAVHFCKWHNDCPQKAYWQDEDDAPLGYFYICNTKLRVCVPERVQTVDDAAAAAVGAASNAPLPQGSAAGTAGAGPGRRGAVCDPESKQPGCRAPLACQLDYLSSDNYVCQ